MNANPKRIIVTESCCHACDVDTVLVHHQHFPEMRAEGRSAELAAEHLLDRLTASLDCVPDAAHREAVGVALDDIRAFLERKVAIHPARDLTAHGAH